MSIESSRGVSIPATKSSKYAHSPSNEKEVRAGRTTCVSGGGCIRSAREACDWNPMERESSLGNTARHATKAAGEMYPVWGMSRSTSSTRSLAEERSVDNAGIGTPLSRISLKHGANPPKNPPGRVGTFLPMEEIER